MKASYIMLNILFAFGLFFLNALLGRIQYGFPVSRLLSSVYSALQGNCFSMENLRLPMQSSRIFLEISFKRL